MNCPNCMSLTAEVAEIRTIVERLDHELLGNGQPGKIRLIDDKVANLQQWRSYVDGALRVIGLVLGVLVTAGGIILAAKLKAGN